MKAVPILRCRGLLFATIGFILGIGTADEVVAKSTIEEPQLAAPLVDIETRFSFEIAQAAAPRLVIDAGASVFDQGLSDFRGLASSELANFAYVKIDNSCSLVEQIEILHQQGDCRMPLSGGCACDAMGTTHGGGGCASCNR